MAAVQSIYSPGCVSPRSRVTRDAASSTSLGDTSWHFPFGPSTQFHRSERTRPSHTRNKSSYTPNPPSLSIERRIAHRRTRSSANVGACASPQVNESVRSPLSQFCSNARRPATATMASRASQGDVPRTPVKSKQRTVEYLRDSPSSDYFTDDARSVDRSQSWGPVDPETQRLLVRLNMFQAQLMREGYSEDALSLVNVKMDEMEQELSAFRPDSAFGHTMRDSGVFMDNEADIRQVTNHEENAALLERSAQSGVDVYDSREGTMFTTEQRAAKNDFLLLKSHRILDNLNRSHSEYQNRLDELRLMVENNTTTIEEKDRQIEDLLQKNTSLKSALEADNSELLFLKLQLKALEVDIHAASHEQQAELAASTSHWREDWDEVDVRFRRRRSAYGLVTKAEPKRTDSFIHNDTLDPWEVQTVKKARGRVSTIIVRRIDPSQAPSHSVDVSHDDAFERELGRAVAATSQVRCTDPSTQTSSPTPAPLPKVVNELPAYTHSGTQTDCRVNDTSCENRATKQDTEHDINVNEEESNNDDDDDDGSEDISNGTQECYGDDLALIESLQGLQDRTHPSPSQKATQQADRPIVPSTVRVAWTELWQSLSEMAGMGDERF